MREGSPVAVLNSDRGLYLDSRAWIERTGFPLLNATHELLRINIDGVVKRLYGGEL